MVYLTLRPPRRSLSKEREREREKNPICKRPLDVCGLKYVKHPILLCKHMPLNSAQNETIPITPTPRLLSEALAMCLGMIV